MFQSRFRFTLVIADGTGFPVHREEVQDFMPLYEDLLFRAVLAGVLPNDGSLPTGTLTPVFGEGSGSWVAALAARLAPAERTYGLGLLAARVQAVMAERRHQGEPATTQASFTWHLEARRLEQEAERPRLRSWRRRRPYPIVRSSLLAFGVPEGAREETPVWLFARREVVDSLRQETAQHLEVERAHVLLGHLIQENGQAAVVVTGHSPVEAGTGASRAHFPFTPDTFLAIRREVDRRPDGAGIVGWHHSHPPVCGAACLQHVPACNAGMLFFSVPEDHAVHRAAFAAPYMVALVTGKEPGRRADEPGLRAFGWQDGEITERRFEVCG